MVVLWVLTIASLLAAGLQSAIRTELLVADETEQRIVARWLARAGVERAVAEIMSDLGPADGPRDRWYDSPLDFQQIPLEGGAFYVYHGGPAGGQKSILFGVEDESGKLNVNSATKEQLMRLPDMTTEVADCIIDWRDADDEVSQEGVEGGYYAELTHPYKIRNGPFQTIRELLLVKGVERELLFGEDANLDGVLNSNENDGDASPPADNGDGVLDSGWAAWLTVHSYEKNVSGLGTDRTNLNDASADQLIQLGLQKDQADAIVKQRGQKQFEKITDLLDVNLDQGGSAVNQETFRKLVDYMSISGEKRLPGKINVNTASREVLMTLFTDDDVYTVDAIIAFRDSDQGPFTDIGQLLDVQGLTLDKFKQIVGLVTVRTSVFTIRSEGDSDRGPSAVVEAVVDRGESAPKTLYWHQRKG